MKVLAPLAISLLLVSGCSTSKYDEVEVVIYERCLNTFNYEGPYQSSREILDLAMKACADLKPVKRS